MAVSWRGKDRYAAPAAVDLSLKEFHIARHNSDGTVGFATTPAEAIGVLIDNPLAGETATVQVGDIVQVVTGAAVAVNALLAPNGTGRAITGTTGQRCILRALSATGGDGQLATCLVGRVETAA